MFRKVLLPTDFDELAGRLVRCVSDLQKAGLEEIVLLHVIDADELNRNLLESFRAEKEERHREIARIKLQEYVQAVEAQGLRAKALVTTGIPSNEIVRVAAAEEVAMIIGGSQRQRGKDEDELDTTTARVIRKSKLPVLVIKLKQEEISRAGECDRFCHHLFHKVLLPVDWSECSRATLAQVPKLRGVIDRILVSHVMDERVLRHLEAGKIEEYRQNDLNRLEEVRRELSRHGLAATTHLHVGHPGAEINRIADEQDVSLILIGKKGKTGLKEMLWGSTSEHLVRQSNRSVLVWYCCD